jgi:hypothetical protein
VKRHINAVSDHKEHIKRALKVARENWNNWKDVFEYRGSIADNPLVPPRSDSNISFGNIASVVLFAVECTKSCATNSRTK